MIPQRFLLCVVVCVVCAGCTRVGVIHRYEPPTVTNRGCKPASLVAPHARAMVAGKMTLAECLQQPESIADKGVGCMRAISDLPVDVSKACQPLAAK